MPQAIRVFAACAAASVFACLAGQGVRAQCQPVVLAVPPGGGSLLGTNLPVLVTLRNGDLVAAGLLAAGPGVARWDGTTWSLFSGFTPNLAASCGIERANGDLVVGGYFFGFGGSSLQRWNGTGWTSIAYLPPPAPVYALLERPNGTLVTAGPNGVLVQNGSSWTALGGAMPGLVAHVVQLANGDIVAGGTFPTAGGTAVNNVARFDGVAWRALGAGFDGPVTRLAVTRSGELMAGGSFTLAGAVPVNGIARWDGTAWHALGVGLTAATEVNGIVELPDGDIVVAGEFTHAGGIAAARIARWNGSAWSPFTTGAPATIRALAWLPRGVLAIGGSFQAFAGVAAPTFAAVGTSCPASGAALATGCAGSGGPNTLTVRTLPWADATFRAEGSGLPATSLAIAVTSFQSLAPPVPLGAVFPSHPGCDLHVAPDILGLLLPTAGTVESSLFLPNTPPLVGLTFYHQLVVIESDALGAFVDVTASDALALTVGDF